MADEQANYTLGSSDGELQFEGAEAVQQHIVSMSGQARRSLLIFSPTLTHRVYSNVELGAAISAGIREYHRLRVKILICNPQLCVAQHHHLIELAQQLSSFIEIRRTHKDHQTRTDDYLIADNQGYIHRPYFERFTAGADYHNPLKAQNDAKLFMEIWDKRVREQEFLRLYL